jgi:hypothetical protein
MKFKIKINKKLRLRILNNFIYKNYVLYIHALNITYYI